MHRKVITEKEADQIRVILIMVASDFGLELKDMFVSNRTPNHSDARHLAMYCFRELLGLKLTRIAELFDCHHTNVIYAVEKIAAFLTNDKKTSEKLKNTIDKIKFLI